MRKTLIWVVLAIWLVLFGASFAVFALVEPSGDGFTRGANRVMGFLLLQMGAGFVGTAIWMMRKVFAAGTWQRWLARLPAGLFSLLLLSLVLIVVWARLAPTGA
ncbi:MAG: hypothetical protein AAF216_11840 [Pseudomonadota bacterium]